MTVMRTKKEVECRYHSLEDLTASLKLATTSLDWNEISSQKTEEVLQRLESLRIVIQARQVRAERSTTI